MIIVLLHAIYLLGKLVYRRYSSTVEADDGMEQQTLIKEIDFHDEYKDMWSNAMSKTDGSLKRRYSNCDNDESKPTIRFSPPASIQRYQAVLEVLAKYGGKLNKVVEFGCSELAFCVYLKTLEGLEELLFVDVDREILDMYKMRAKPLHVDYLHRRNRPLVIKLLEGSITQPDQSLENCDAVISIELIEHLYPEPLTQFPYNVFGFIKPKVAIITTPNIEFNVLFTNLKGLRNPDHKFEWTRNQFQDWAYNITTRFPDYDVSFHGICNGPPGTEHLGSCSQMAVFHKKIDLNQEKVHSVPGLYHTVEVYEYPYEIDNRSDEQKILDDAAYFIRKFSYAGDGEYIEEVPLHKLLFVLSKFFVSMEQLKEILTNGNFSVVDKEDGPVVLVPPESDSFSDHNTADDDFLDYDVPSGENNWETTHIHDMIEDDDGWDSDPEPPSNYFCPEQHTETWDNETSEPSEAFEAVRSSSANNFTSEMQVTNSTVSIYPDDMSLNDIILKNQSSELSNSQMNSSIAISSFSEIQESDNSENSQNETAALSSCHNTDLNSSFSLYFPDQRVQINSGLKTNDNVDLPECENDSMCSMYLETSNLSRDRFSKEVINSSLDSTVTSLENNVYKESKLNKTVFMNDLHENTFEEPNCTSSPHTLSTVTLNSKKKVHTLTEPSSLSFTLSKDQNLFYSNESKFDATHADSNESMNEEK